MPYRSLVATGILMFLSVGCGSWNTPDSSQTPSSPVPRETPVSASPSALKSEASSLPALPANVFREKLPRLKQKTGVPILLPSKLPDFAQPIYANATGDSNSYSITLSSTPNCTANAYFIGSFQASQAGQPSFDQTVLLAQNLQGYYKPLSCGASCSPPAIVWADKGVLYEVQLSLPNPDQEAVKNTLIQIANSAIEAGAR